ncbi:hypothetical protein GII32_22160 [Gordonia amarae]|uniref:hypothetical protein n=1 Tax=Gordonia amarae TaxID=36821 RepID=UPI001AF83449|nr:hypothetical protein [Gordonia amarae]QHN32730.1 hypothetical protein GII32_22160 [Gordonia amarae]
MRMRSRLLAAVTGTVLTVPAITLVGQAAPAAAAPSSLERVESEYQSSSPITSVVSSVVRHKVPLAKSFGPHPAQCDWVSYLRFRSADGPAKSSDADRILVAQPGVLEGAGAFESVAKNTIVKAAKQGKRIEFWALDRRSNCLEDHTGLTAATDKKSFDVAANYYFKGKPVNGKRFAGFTNNLDNIGKYGWLKNIGVKQTLEDQYAIMKADVPDQQTRKRKMLCGGHSLGGFITGYFAEWDFDGNRATTGDAGYNQCAGYFALDTGITSDLTAMSNSLNLPPGIKAMVQMPAIPKELGQVADLLYGLTDSVLPVLALPTLINPETLNLLALAALAADTDPHGVNALIDALPHNFNIDSTLRILLSKDYGTAITGQPNIRNIRATNQAVLGAIMDDNSMPFGILQSSVGMVAPGAPVVAKSFPLPDNLAKMMPMSAAAWGDNKKVAPSRIDGKTLYRWADYDQIKPNDTRTHPWQEVSSISELARNMSEPPLDFTEWYFPTSLFTSLMNRASPEAFAHRLYPNAALRAPMGTFQAGGGIGIDNPRGHGRLITLPGYNHLDVLTAAAKQNNGRPERVSENLAAMAVDPRSMN